MIRHAHRTPIAHTRQYGTPEVDHIESLRKFIYRRDFADLTDEARKRLDGVIATYQRLYVPR